MALCECQDRVFFTVFPWAWRIYASWTAEFVSLFQETRRTRSSSNVLGEFSVPAVVFHQVLDKLVHCIELTALLIPRCATTPH